jgi:hypothetical protein
MTSTCPLDVRFWAIFCIVVANWVSQEPMLFIGQDVVPVKVTRNVAVDDVFK